MLRVGVGTGAILLSLLPLAQAPDLILVNGRIFTAVAERPFVDALAITGTRIAAVGTSASMVALAGSGTQVIDLHGRLAIPGFNDAHTHFMPDWIGKTLQVDGLDPSCQDVLTAVRHAAHTEAAGTVITASIGASAFFDAECSPARLTDVAPDHPVMLHTWTPHAAMMNRAMSRRLGIHEDDPPVVGGFFGKSMQASHWDGTVHEYEALRLYAQLLNRTTESQRLREFLESAASWGITSIQLMAAPESSERLVDLLATVDPPIRVRVIPFPFTNRTGRLTPVYPSVPMRVADRVSVDGVKWLLDGTPIERSAALREPYMDNSTWSGAMNFPDSEIRTILTEVRESNVPLMVHAVGDRTTEAFLQAMEQTGGSAVWASRRVRIEHGDGILPDLLPRVRHLGAVVVVNPTHLTVQTPSRGGGADTSSVRQPMRRLLQAGIPLAIGSDGAMNPFLNIMLATTDPRRPSDALSRQEAITAYTATAAFAEFAENRKGTLESGKLADVAVLSQDILQIPLPDLVKTQAVLTIVGGKVVHRAK